jgi:hypothetical protein
MTEKKAKVLVIGTRHEIQRHQDTKPEREELRAEFDKRLRRILEERKTRLIAEEAGDDKEVLEKLKLEDSPAQAFAREMAEELKEKLSGKSSPEIANEIEELLGVTPKTANDPIPTIAKKIADERPKEIQHVDIRPPNADELSSEQRDEAMSKKILEIIKDGEEAVVIVGESHREGVATRLKDAGLSVDSVRFP